MYTFLLFGKDLRVNHDMLHPLAFPGIGNMDLSVIGLDDCRIRKLAGPIFDDQRILPALPIVK
jgi:hypothetical protein